LFPSFILLFFCLEISIVSDAMSCFFISPPIKIYVNFDFLIYIFLTSETSKVFFPSPFLGKDFLKELVNGLMTALVIKRVEDVLSLSLFFFPGRGTSSWEYAF